MLDFRPSSTPYYRQRIDYGRLIMMVLSSALLLSLVLTFGRPRTETGATDAAGPGEPAAEAAAEAANPTLVGVAVLVGSLCVVACAMLVLFRLTRPGRVRFALHDGGGAPPDFSSLEAPAANAGTEAASFSELSETHVEPQPTPEPHDAVSVPSGDSAAVS
ncbi:MAG TPA: hypothetical protein VHC22_03185 [Pirellulales bacterium]|nr:hypothetical protein [Pirellulales bacterium]